MKKKIVPAVRPLGDNVLIAPRAADARTAAGIFLPETASKEKPQQGTVVAIGDSDKIRVAAGQDVIYARYAGTEIAVDGADYLIVKNTDILAVIG